MKKIRILSVALALVLSISFMAFSPLKAKANGDNALVIAVDEE